MPRVPKVPKVPKVQEVRTVQKVRNVHGVHWTPSGLGPVRTVRILCTLRTLRTLCTLRTVCTLCTFMTLSIACSGINSKTNSFATLAEARQAGAIEQGWVPEGLPPGAHDLREAHLPGSSRHWGLFEYPQSQEQTLRALLQPGEISLDGQQCDIPHRIEWWPVQLRGNLDARRLGATGLQAYRARKDDVIFAVNWRQGRAYYWTP